MEKKPVKKKRSKNALLSRIDHCKTISELFDVIKEEGIVVRMQCLPGASNIPSKKSNTGYGTRQTEFLERLKRSVMMQIEDSMPDKKTESRKLSTAEEEAWELTKRFLF